METRYIIVWSLLLVLIIAGSGLGYYIWVHPTKPTPPNPQPPNTTVPGAVSKLSYNVVIDE